MRQRPSPRKGVGAFFICARHLDEKFMSKPNKRNNMTSVLELKMLKHHSLSTGHPQPYHGWELSPGRLWSYTTVAG